MSKIYVDEILPNDNATVDGSNLSAVPASAISALNSSAMPAGSIVQMKTANLGSAFSTTSDSEVDTGLSVTITPTSTSNRIYCMLLSGTQGGSTTNTEGVCAIYRDTGSGDSFRAYFDSFLGTTDWKGHSGFMDDGLAPQTSAITYSVYARSRGPSGTYYFHLQYGGVVSWPYLVVMEVAG